MKRHVMRIADRALRHAQGGLKFSKAGLRIGLWIGAMALIAPSLAGQSLSYTKGQNISPAYEGWEQASRKSRWAPSKSIVVNATRGTN